MAKYEKTDVTVTGGSDGTLKVTYKGPFYVTGPNGYSSGQVEPGSVELGGLKAGWYNVITFNEKIFGFNYPVGSIEIREPSEIKVVASVTDASPSTVCNLCSADGSIKIVSLTGGAEYAEYAFQWYGPAGYEASTQDIDKLKPGDYTVIVTAAPSGWTGDVAQYTETYTVSQQSSRFFPCGIPLF